MTLLRILLTIFFVVLVIMFFTRPTDEFCRKRAAAALMSHRQTMPGYENPLDPAQSAAPVVDSMNIIITNHIFWKSVGYTGANGYEKLGYALFNSYYDVSQKKNNTQ